MKIIYKQQSEKSGIKNAYLKELTFRNDYKKATLKFHYHNDYEIHIVFSGMQSYEISGELYEVKAHEFILIPPNVKHCMVSASENLYKYTVTFNSANFSDGILYHGKTPDRVTQSIEFISEEEKRKLLLSFQLIQNRVFEMITLLLRQAGYKEKSVNPGEFSNDEKNKLAKKFISDNIELNLSVKDVALYCHLSERQLTRNFISEDGISPAKYIMGERMKRVSEYIKNSELTLKQISEKFSFSNEYYFNTVFKKHFGMPPHAYRKMNS